MISPYVAFRFGMVTPLAAWAAIRIICEMSALSVDYPVVNRPPGVTITRLQWPSGCRLVTSQQLSDTEWPTHIQFSVQWIGRQCTYLPLLCSIPTGHPNPLTMLLHPVQTGRHISNWVFNGLASNVNIYHCSVSY